VATITGTTITSGYTLLTNPTTITNTGTVGNTASYGVAVAGPAGTNWTLVNSGLVRETATGGIGISFASAGTVENLGRVIANNGPSGGIGIYLPSGGRVVNGAPGGTVSSAYISAYQNAVQIGGTGTLINYGIIHGYGGATAVVLADGTVINGASGATGAQINVGGDNALQITGTGTVTNYGTINNPVGPGNYYGIQLNGAGVINNLGTASLIRGYYAAISGGHDDTITNAGTIAVNTGGNHGTDAIKFGSGTNRLIVDPGAVFIGAVYGGSGGTSVLELASGSSAGTITGLGTSITNFNSLVFDTGADWKITGNDSANGLGSLGITGFHSGDTIELTGFVAVNQTFASNLLTLGDGTGHFESLNIQGSFVTGDFQITGTGGNTDITLDAPCYRRGTRILTDRGEIAVEDLSVGDLVPTITSGRAEPIVWIGYRHENCSRHNEPEKVWPVRVAADAFGAGMPHEDLFLSPDHAVFVDGVLIPVQYLINGRTIAQVPVDQVSYYHIELATHEVILAQGLPAETYLDTGDRAKFGNSGGAVPLLAKFPVCIWEASGCAPLIVTGPLLASVRHDVNARADAMDVTANLLVA
jgi:hypothetical protein